MLSQNKWTVGIKSSAAHWITNSLICTLHSNKLNKWHMLYAMRWNYHIKIALFKRSRSYKCSTRGWYDWCSTRLCIAERLQKLYHGRTPRFHRGAPGFIFLKAKTFVSLVSRCHTIVCLQWTSDTKVALWPLSLFRGCPLNTALSIRTQNQNSFVHTPPPLSCVVCIFLLKKILVSRSITKGIILWVFAEKTTFSLILHGREPFWYSYVDQR